MTNVLRAYRRLLRQISLIPKERERTAAWSEAYTRFRHHAIETDPKRIATLVSEAESKLSYLKMITPRLKGGRTSTANSADERVPLKRKYVVRDGELVEGHGQHTSSGQVISNWGMGNPDPGAVRKHWQLFRKQVKLGL